MAKLDKLTCFKEIKSLGDRWLKGDKQGVVTDLLEMRKPKPVLYAAAVHRYLVKEKDFAYGSEFVTMMLNDIAE